MGLLTGARLIAIDTETTGMNPADGAALVEVASVALENGEIAETWSSLVYDHLFERSAGVVAPPRRPGTA